jgi:3'-phosphoadenosine 5'-phosphosulfate (PAPS) 3'-phosphatase
MAFFGQPSLEDIFIANKGNGHKKYKQDKCEDKSATIDTPPSIREEVETRVPSKGVQGQELARQLHQAEC